MELILASQSPRRKALLAQIGLQVRVIAPTVDETLFPGEPPQAAVARLSVIKAAQVAEDYPQTLVLAADTVVSLDDAILGKPASESAAQQMLAQLSDRWHNVYTGFTLRCDTQIHTEVVKTEVKMMCLDSAVISAYVQTGEPMDKAGSYGIQGKGGVLVEAISGDYYNVVGLPIQAVSVALNKFGCNVWSVASGIREK